MGKWRCGRWDGAHPKHQGQTYSSWCCQVYILIYIPKVCLVAVVLLKGIIFAIAVLCVRT